MRALVTGCSTGIGRATVAALMKRGYEVVATARRPESLDELDATLRLPLDVDDDDSVSRAVARAGEIDILVNNAAWGVYGPVEALEIDDVRGIFETNVLGPLRLIQALAPGMRERQRGVIVNISSGSAVFPQPANAAYAASKAALETVSEALRYELAHWGIGVLVIEPGEIKTAWADKEKRVGWDGPYHDLVTKLLEGYPSPDAPGPEVVANVILEAVECENPKFRWPVNLPQFAIDARRSMSDEEFEQAYRRFKGLDW